MQHILNSNPKFYQKKRMFFVLKVFSVFFLILALRIAWLQFVRGAEYQQKAMEQQTKDSIITSKRGVIFDRNNKVLAKSASVDTVTATPKEIKDAKNADKVSEELSKILNEDKQDIYKKITKNSSYEIIKRKIEPEQSEKIKKLNLKGIHLIEDSKRYYPFNNLASHVIGFVGDDNQGLNGIEMIYDKYLKGVPGRVVAAKNALGTEMPYKYEKYINAQNGINVVLTIDEVIQHFAEKYLEEAVEKYGAAKGGACIVMNAKTGEILAMSTKPDYDLNKPFEVTNPAYLEEIDKLTGKDRIKKLGEARNAMWRNKAVVDTYEPGSTYKTFVAAAALEENVVKLDDMFNCPGYAVYGGQKMRCHNVSGHGTLTFKKGVESSCNPTFMAVGARIGKTAFIRYHKLFGFTQPTGFELPGEASGIFFSPERFNEVELATSSFGQGFNVTPLQLVTALTAITNNGVMIKPRIVKELVDDDGVVVKSYESEEIRQVISAETAKTVREILEGVVSEGTSKNAYIKGFRVAGKTGTSEKQPRGSGKYIASFLGFAPANDPEIIGLVMLDEPTGALYMGGQIAAPTFRSIFDDTLRYLGIDPQYTEEDLKDSGAMVPNTVGMSIEEAKNACSQANLQYKVIGSGDKVLEQNPRSGITVSTDSVVMLYTENSDAGTVTVPNVVGMSVTQANQALTNQRLNMKIADESAAKTDGQSYIGSQKPEAGAVVSSGTVVTVDILYKDVH